MSLNSPSPQREQDDADNRLRPPGYFVPSAVHRALCAHCDEHVFHHTKVLVRGAILFACPSLPTELRAPDEP